MRRFATFLRASGFALFGFVGLAVFAWGVVGWWSFHRDLYVEEEQALAALAGEVGSVRYRREGALRTRLLEGKKKAANADAPEAPWSVPFVGRVEFIDARVERQNARPANVDLALQLPASGYPSGYVAAAQSPELYQAAVAGTRAIGAPTVPPYVPSAARLQAAQLPGLKEFRDAAPKAISHSPIDLSALSVTLPVPTFPTSFLHPKHLAEPFPSGEPLEEAERVALAQEIADAWSNPKESKTRLIYVSKRTIYPQRGQLERSTSIHLRDAGRSFDFAALPYELDSAPDRPANVLVSTDDGAWEFSVTGQNKIPLGFRPHDAGDDVDDAPDRPHRIGKPYDPYRHMEGLPDDPLGEGGEHVVSIERIDDQRLRIEARSVAGALPITEEAWRFRAVVRTDLDHAIEQYDWFLRHAPSDAVPGTPQELVYREIRWLAKRKGEPIVTERLSDPWPLGSGVGGDTPAATVPASSLEDAPPAPKIATHSLIATMFDPIYPKEVFDPAMYGAKAWPAPRKLPDLRSDQIAMAAGGACLALALIGSLARRIFVRRRVGERRRRWVALRFGFVSALAAALLAISAAGWVKVRVDEANDQQALLSELARLDDRFSFERGEPEFPWLFVSTETFPIGARLASVDLRLRPSPELLDRLLRSSPDLRLHIGRTRVPKPGDPITLAKKALGEELPEFEVFDWGEGEIYAPIERGEPLSSEENEATLREMLAAWRGAQENRPSSYLLRQQSTLSSIERGIAVRDGDRSWTFDMTQGQVRIDVDDGRVRRRFERDGEEWLEDWVLSDRFPVADEPFSFVAPPRKQFFGNDDLAPWRRSLNSPGVANFVQSSQFAAYVRSANQPVASPDEVRLPAPPFALPPGLKVEYRLDEKLLQGPNAVKATFERLPTGDLRAEFDWSAVPHMDGASGATPDEASATWTLLVRPDLDWCVEKCDVVEYFQSDLTPAIAFRYGAADPALLTRLAAVGAGPALKVALRREIHSRHALERRDGHVLLLEARLAGAELLAQQEYSPQYESVRYAVELNPAIDPRRFDRATLASPDPPQPIEPWLPWHRATFFAALALFAYAGSRRAIEFWIARRRKRVAIDAPQLKPDAEVDPSGIDDVRDDRGAEVSS